jgi:hypothetical protein
MNDVFRMIRMGISEQEGYSVPLIKALPSHASPSWKTGDMTAIR